MASCMRLDCSFDLLLCEFELLPEIVLSEFEGRSQADKAHTKKINTETLVIGYSLIMILNLEFQWDGIIENWI